MAPLDKPADIRWQQRFSNYQKALAQLRRFVFREELNELEEQGLIQYFKCIHELAWKTLRDFLKDQGDVTIFDSKDATREAFKVSLIGEGATWMAMIQDRNQTNHTYNPETAKAIVANIKERFFPLFTALEYKLQTLQNTA